MAKSPRNRSRRRSQTAGVPSAALGCVALLTLAGFGLLAHFFADRPAPELAVGSAAASATGQSDEQLRRAAVGTWQDFYHGTRTLTLREDGTATMVVEFGGLKARLFTPRLRLDLTWTIENGRMTRRTLGGDPEDKVQFVVDRVGGLAVETILDLGAARMLLAEPDGSQRYQWQRVR